MNLFLVKLQNDRIFREGTFPEMRSEYVADIAAVPVARTTEFRVREHLLRTVPIVRDAAGSLLDAPAVCDFITSPAVNRTLARFLFSRATLDRTMEERIGRIVALAARKRPDVLVLGAYGCGVFGNRRETVYPQFERAINRYLPDGVEVVFADPHPPPAFLP